MTARLVRSLAVIPLLSGCYLFHGLDGDESPDASDAGEADWEDDATPPDPGCPEPLRLRLDCELSERVAERALPGYGHVPSGFLDLTVHDGRVSLLLGEEARACSVVTLAPEVRRLFDTASYVMAPFIRGGVLLKGSPHPAAMVMRAGDSEGAIVHTMEPVRLEWLAGGEEPDERVLPPLETWCSRCVVPVVGGPDEVHLVRPSERLFEIARVDVDAMTVTPVDHDAPPRPAWSVPTLAAAELSGIIAVAGGNGWGEAIPAFGAIVGPDGGTRDVAMPGSLADPAPVVASDPSRERFVWARHVTRSDDTYDASVYVWTVDPDGTAGPRIRIPTPGGSAFLSMSATASDGNGAVVAWTDRVPGSLTDSRAWVLPLVPDVDRCAVVSARPIATLPDGALEPEVRAIAHDGALYVFYVEDTTPGVLGGEMLAVDRVECSLRPVDP